MSEATTSKKAFDLSRDSIYVAEPITELCLVGGQNPEFKLPEDQWGDLDTEADDTHALYDERLSLPLSEEFIANIDAYGVLVPILIAKVDGLACVVAGRQRVRAARVVNRRRKARGEPLIKIRCAVRRSNDSGLLGAMIVENEARMDDAVETKISKLRRLLDRGVSEADAAITFGCSQATIRGYLAYDDHATDSVKKAVESGRISQTAAAHVVKLKDPEKQQAALDVLLSQPAGSKLSRRAAKTAAKRVAKPESTAENMTRREQKRFIDFVQGLPHPNASEKTLAWWQGVEDALKLVVGSEGVDERLTATLAKFRAEVAE